LPTRGTTAPQRLRRVDRWTVWSCAGVLRAANDPLVIDLGFGAHPATLREFAARLRHLRPDVRVVGVEIDPERVAVAERDLASAPEPGLSVQQGGFELAVPGRPVIVRAMNVLRQYEQNAVEPAWAAMGGRLAEEGVLLEGTCDDFGRQAAWVRLGPGGRPDSLVLSAHLPTLRRPGDLAARLPSCLITRNVAGERVHSWLAALDVAWAASAPLSAFGPRQRFAAAVAAVRADGWPVRGNQRRWRLGEVEVDWSAVAP
jgi:hypothetical protein